MEDIKKFLEKANKENKSIYFERETAFEQLPKLDS